MNPKNSLIITLTAISQTSLQKATVCLALLAVVDLMFTFCNYKAELRHCNSGLIDLSNELADYLCQSFTLTTTLTDFQPTRRPRIRTYCLIQPATKASLSRCIEDCILQTAAKSCGLTKQRAYEVSAEEDKLAKKRPLQSITAIHCMETPANSCGKTSLPRLEDKAASDALPVRKILAKRVLDEVHKIHQEIAENNAKAKKANNSAEDQSEPARDQGFTRPTVLVVFPMKNVAFDFVSELLIMSNAAEIINHDRFVQEFGPPEDPHINKAKRSSPLDYDSVFRDNLDDSFKLGIRLMTNSSSSSSSNKKNSTSNKTAKLYSNFYKSDILVASPLGLRLIIGSSGDAKREFDFLSSLRLLIVDDASVICMQNWDHLENVMEHANLIPKQSHDCDYSRVKSCFLDGNGKYFRQSILISAFQFPELNALFSTHCRNVNGALKIIKKTPDVKASISKLALYPCIQKFARVPVKSLSSAHHDRFEHFTKKILPSLTSSTSTTTGSSTLIFISSYFDFVRLRNHFKKLADADSTITYGILSEYCSTSQRDKARFAFAKGKSRFLLVSERFHFYKRFILQGATNLVFYSLPEHANYYVEFVEMMLANGNNTNQSESTATPQSTVYSLFDGYDALKLERILGQANCNHLLKEAKEKNLFLFS